MAALRASTKNNVKAEFFSTKVLKNALFLEICSKKVENNFSLIELKMN
jgi:hypothetical protein